VGVGAGGSVVARVLGGAVVGCPEEFSAERAASACADSFCGAAPHAANAISTAATQIR
jgi:hypothetical protein